MGKYDGLNNYGKPKQEYIDRLTKMTDEELHTETRRMIWLSAYANNNPRSDYHWMCDATYDEWTRRGKPEGYKRAYDEEYQANFG